jgi:hypothetical protein
MKPIILATSALFAMTALPAIAQPAVSPARPNALAEFPSKGDAKLMLLPQLGRMAASSPVPSAPDRQSNDLVNATGSSYPPGIVSKVTVFSGMPTKLLRLRVQTVCTAMEAFEREYRTKIGKLAGAPDAARWKA